MSDVTEVIPYTHWAYFPSEETARHCAGELADYVTRVDKPQPEDDGEWLLRAGRDVRIDALSDRHDEVAAIVERHGGTYDYGEVTYLGGLPAADPALMESDASAWREVGGFPVPAEPTGTTATEGTEGP